MLEGRNFMNVLKRKLHLGAFAAVGAIAPDILILYSKRWTMPSLTFDPWMYVFASALYMVLAATVAMIYPFGRGVSPWRAFAVGVTLPLLVSGLASLQRGVVIAPRGDTIEGTLWDLLSLF
jgi:hypothetical protein